MEFAELTLRAILGLVGLVFTCLGVLQGVVEARDLSGGKFVNHPIALLVSAMRSIGTGASLFVTSITHDAPAFFI
jgi:hypothetical protein